MKKPNAVLIMFTILFFIMSGSIYASPAKVTNQAPVPSSKSTVNNNVAVPQGDVQLKDVFEALLKAKDDKIVLLSNIVNWILAIAGILVAIIIVWFGSLLKNVNKQSKIANGIISRLQEKEKGITAVQEQINSFLQSEKFSERVSAIELSVQNMEHLMRKWEEEERHEELMSHFMPIRWRMEDFNRNDMKNRIINPKDKASYEVIMEIIKNVEAGQLSNFSSEQLDRIHDRAKQLVNKHKREGDMIV